MLIATKILSVRENIYTDNFDIINSMRVAFKEVPLLTRNDFDFILQIFHKKKLKTNHHFMKINGIRRKEQQRAIIKII